MLGGRTMCQSGWENSGRRNGWRDGESEVGAVCALLYTPAAHATLTHGPGRDGRRCGARSCPRFGAREPLTCTAMCVRGRECSSALLPPPESCLGKLWGTSTRGFMHGGRLRHGAACSFRTELIHGIPRYVGCTQCTYLHPRRERLDLLLRARTVHPAARSAGSPAPHPTHNTPNPARNPHLPRPSAQTRPAPWSTSPWPSRAPRRPWRKLRRTERAAPETRAQRTRPRYVPRPPDVRAVRSLIMCALCVQVRGTRAL